MAGWDYCDDTGQTRLAVPFEALVIQLLGVGNPLVCHALFFLFQPISDHDVYGVEGEKNHPTGCY